MAITESIGYGGQVTEVTASRWAAALGGLDYAVLGALDWKVSAVPAAARTVSIATGGGAGRGVGDVSNGGDEVVLPNPPSGELWYCVVVRRDRSPVPGGLTTFGYATPSADPWAAITNRKQWLLGDTLDEQPLGLVRVARDVAAVRQVIDVRCWQANGGAVAASDYARGYLWRPGTQVMIDTDLWTLGVTNTGVAEWRRTPLLRPVNLLASGPAIAGALPDRVPVYEQAGSEPVAFGSDGYGRVTFPVPFPNALLTFVPSNGSGAAAGDVTLAVSGSTPAHGAGALGDRASVPLVAWGPTSSGRAVLRNVTIRVNWIARGW